MFVIKNITKQFKNSKGIKDFAATFQPSTLTCIAGNNGSGKSTTIKCIFNEYDADKIEGTYNGVEFKKANYLKEISLMPDQSIYPVGVTLLNFLSYYASLRNTGFKMSKKVSLEFLKMVSLDKYANVVFEKLSSGMQKRAMLALCLMTNPKYIFLDEPTANMDIASKKEVIDFINDIKKMGIGIVLITHELKEWSVVIDNLIIISEGEKVLDTKIDNPNQVIELFDKYDTNVKTINKKELIDSFKNTHMD